MSAALKWYDSLWLHDFIVAREIIEKVAPARLAEFIDCFRILRTDPAFMVREAPGRFDADARATERRDPRNSCGVARNA